MRVRVRRIQRSVSATSQLIHLPDDPALPPRDRRFPDDRPGGLLRWPPWPCGRGAQCAARAIPELLEPALQH
jgi:hypothetical protein